VPCLLYKSSPPILEADRSFALLDSTRLYLNNNKRKEEEKPSKQNIPQKVESSRVQIRFAWAIRNFSDSTYTKAKIPSRVQVESKTPSRVQLFISSSAIHPVLDSTCQRSDPRLTSELTYCFLVGRLLTYCFLVDPTRDPTSGDIDGGLIVGLTYCFLVERPLTYCFLVDGP